MAQFDVDAYETVEERHSRALAEYPDLRCVIVNHTTPQDRANSTWVVEARVYLDAGEQANDLPKATEWAFEIDGQGMANKTSALENANTSALGRALRWALAGSKGPSKTEMEKVARGVTPAAKTIDWDGLIANLKNEDEARELWRRAANTNAPKKVTEAILAKVAELGGGK